MSIILLRFSRSFWTEDKVERGDILYTWKSGGRGHWAQLLNSPLEKIDSLIDNDAYLQSRLDNERKGLRNGVEEKKVEKRNSRSFEGSGSNSYLEYEVIENIEELKEVLKIFLNIFFKQDRNILTVYVQGPGYFIGKEGRKVKALRKEFGISFNMKDIEELRNEDPEILSKIEGVQEYEELGFTVFELRKRYYVLFIVFDKKGNKQFSASPESGYDSDDYIRYQIQDLIKSRAKRV